MSFGNQSESLTVPAAAGPNEPSITLGVDIPPELIEHYSPLKIESALIYRLDANRYCYSLVLITPTGPGAKVDGVVDTTKSKPVREYMVYEFSGSVGNFGVLTLGGWGDNSIEHVSVNSITLEANNLLANRAWFTELNVDDLKSSGPGLLRQRKSASASAAVIPTSPTEHVTIPGATVQLIDVPAGATWEAEWNADFDLTGTAGAVVAVVHLNTNTGPVSQQAIWNPSSAATIGARGSSTQTAEGTFSVGGTYQFSLTATRASGTGTARVNALHTRLRVRVYY